MNAHAPPKKGRGLGTAPKTTELLAAYRLWAVSQASPLEKVKGAYAAIWEREAARLFREFWRVGDQRHLRAFVRHVHAMRVHQGRSK
jgi:hypothetical protein